MSEMIERVARAIAEGGGSDWDVCLKAPGQVMAKMYRRMAVNAIEAMREPTAEMVAAGSAYSDWNGAAGGWDLMIEAALNEK